MSHRKHPLADRLTSEPKQLLGCSHTELRVIYASTAAGGVPVALLIALWTANPWYAPSVLGLLFVVVGTGLAWLVGQLQYRYPEGTLNQRARLALDTLGLIPSGLFRVPAGRLSVERN